MTRRRARRERIWRNKERRAMRGVRQYFGREHPWGVYDAAPPIGRYRPPRWRRLSRVRRWLRSIERSRD